MNKRIAQKWHFCKWFEFYYHLLVIFCIYYHFNKCNVTCLKKELWTTQNLKKERHFFIFMNYLTRY